MARICIVTPGQIGSNPRVVKEAQALHEAGFQVTVIATRVLDCVEPRDQSLMRHIPWRLVRVDLRAGWPWRFKRAIQIAFRQAFAATDMARFVERGFSAFTRPLVKAALRVPADFYIAHYPAALPAAAAAARRHSARYAYDAEDFHLGDWPDAIEYHTERRLLRTIEARYLHACAHITAASPGIADAYAETYRIVRPAVVLNVFPRSQGVEAASACGTAAPGPSIYWFSQTIGENRGLECAVRAIGRAKSRPHLYLRGDSAESFIESLRHIARREGVDCHLHFLPPEAPSTMERLAAIYDIGFSGECGHTRNNRMALGNKLFSYLLAGLPILMSDVPAHLAFAEDLGDAAQLFPVDDADALAQAMDHWLTNLSLLNAARAAAWELGQARFNWDYEKERFLAEVDGTLNRPSTPDEMRNLTKALAGSGVIKSKARI